VVSVTADLLTEGDQIKIVATGNLSRHRTDATTAVVSDADRPMVLDQFTRTIDTNELPFACTRPRCPRGRADRHRGQER